MLCEKCQKNEANVHMQSIVNGNQREAHLCSECAAQMSMPTGSENPLPLFSSQSADTPWNSDFDSLFAGLGQWLTGASPKTASTAAPMPQSCPLCGATPSDIAAKGRAGCPECYHVFSPLFAPIIRRIHGSAVHTGSIPASAGTALKRQRQLEELKSKLHAAVAAQEYEQAAKLRDEIQSLESEKE